MPVARTALQSPAFQGRLPYPIFFRLADMPRQASYPWHRHNWGEFVYSFSGVLEVKLAGGHYLVPPQYGLWLPQGVEHIGFNRSEVCHCSLYVSSDLCRALPAVTSSLAVTPLVRAILEYLRQAPSPAHDDEQYQRLLMVLVDQLGQTERIDNYLPMSEDDVLGKVLEYLEANPGDNRSVAELAAWAGTNDRSLNRYCQRDLGMPLVQWRQRLRVIKAFALLNEGRTVDEIARGLGYGSASAFIVMFKKMVGQTPDEFRAIKQSQIMGNSLTNQEI